MRFPEFSGEWEIHKLSEYLDFKNGLNPDAKRFGRGLPFISVMDILADRVICYDNIRAKVEATDKEIECFGVNKGDLLFQRSSETFEDVGRANVYMDNRTAIYGGFVIRGRKIGNYDPLFFKYLLATPLARKRTCRMGAGAQHFNIGQEGLSKISLHFPSIKEQSKIANLFSLIDERVETQKKIIEDLKKLKDAIAEKLFCCPDDESPELRVENSSDRWNLYRLKDVCQRITERNSQKSSSLVLTIAAQYGLVSQTDFFNKSVASENLSNYYLIRKGDFAYNKSYSGEYAWGAVKRLELYEKGVLSPLYICFRPNPLIVYSDFLSHYFETHKWHNGIAQIAGEGARNHGLLNISISDFFETIHRFPELPEQQRIASYLNSLSDKISLANKVLESYTRQKRYLLARMFI